MLSGIGSPDCLRLNGIVPRHALPGLGRNLQDHLQVRLVFKCHKPTLNDEVRSLFGRARIALRYALFRSGPMTMVASLATGFLKTRADLDVPDIQFHVQPWSADSPGEGVHPFSAFTMSVCQLRPESRGEIRLNGPDPMAYPRILPNYLSTGTDCLTIVDSVNVARRIATSEPLASRIAEKFRPDALLSPDDYAGTLDWARWIGHGTILSRSVTPQGRAGWDRGPMQWRTPDCGCMASKVFVLRIARSCRNWSAATPMRQRS